MYAIIDIETTGLSPANEKITEIAVYVFDGQKIIDEFISLVNPERSIPFYITKLTGISNEMVANAPKFYEIARRIIEITDKKIFVAHNVDFDYGFIKAEFASLGYEFKRNKLCTVKLSKKIIPGKKSYSLGNLAQDLGIQINGRHRAAGDAFATVQLFQLLLQIDAKSKPLIEEMTYHSYKGLHPSFNRAVLDTLPEKTGVYYLYDEEAKLIYIGKSTNIKARVIQHLNNITTKKAIEMKSKIVDVSYEITGSELIALLMESDEIKKETPKYNSSQRKDTFYFGIYSYIDSYGYINLKISPNTGEQIPLTSFLNQTSARNFMEELAKKYNLCQKFCGLYSGTGNCFNYGIKECMGACIGNEDCESYNQRAIKAVNSMQYRFTDFLIIDKGRNNTEKSVVFVKNCCYQGFGYFNPEFTGNRIEEILECIKRYPDNKDIQIIIKGYMDRNKNLSIYPLKH